MIVTEIHFRRRWARVTSSLGTLRLELNALEVIAENRVVLKLNAKIDNITDLRKLWLARQPVHVRALGRSMTGRIKTLTIMGAPTP
jgi:hypothetical protein